MKKIFLSIGLGTMMFLVHPNITKANEPTSTTILKPIESDKAKSLLLRLEQINAMDKSDLSIIDKRELKVEVRSIHKELKSINGGLYISAGALIVILLLLIIIL